jgi:hypothetical protein
MNSAIGALRKIVDKFTSRIDWFGSYPCTVISQSSDLETVEVKPDSNKLADLPPGVPIRWGIAGVKCRLSSGSRVLVSFEEGDPSKPYVSMWQNSTSEEIQLGDASDFVALSTSLNSWITKMNLHVHTTSTGPSGPPLQGTSPIVFTGQLASNKVKA